VKSSQQNNESRDSGLNRKINIMASINKFTGAWNVEHAAHLFRRATFGVGYTTLKEFGNKTLDDTITALFQPIAMPSPPINLNYTTDPNVPVGQTWVDKGTSQNVDPYRVASLRAWTMDLLTTRSTSIREKMVLFWHNHFVTADLTDPRFDYKYITLLRSYALGNFKSLATDITIDPGMLQYLNGNQNTNKAPNENYARELMELFTLGKGPIAGPGDYTTYTETDIKEIAKVLTGWIDRPGLVPVTSSFNAAAHDTTTKKLSARFNNVSIPNGGINEYKTIIDIIFQKEEVSLYLARKIYIWFVSSTITSEIENDIIKPLAKIFRDNNYEIKPMIKTLLESEHFYDACVRGVIVKNPIDFLLNELNHFELAYPTDAIQKASVMQNLYIQSNTMQMAYFRAPSVAGWQAFYQEPSFHRLWLNSVSLPARKVYSDTITNAGLAVGTFRIKLDALKILKLFPNPSNAEAVVKEFAILMLSKPLAANQITHLKTLLANGSIDSVWTTTYNAYVAAPTDNTKITAVTTRLSKLLEYMMRMPEYHLS
jgi:hypothetical protein